MTNNDDSFEIVDPSQCEEKQSDPEILDYSEDIEIIKSISDLHEENNQNIQKVNELEVGLEEKNRLLENSESRNKELSQDLEKYKNESDSTQSMQEHVVNLQQTLRDVRDENFKLRRELERTKSSLRSKEDDLRNFRCEFERFKQRQNIMTSFGSSNPSTRSSLLYSNTISNG